MCSVIQINWTVNTPTFSHNYNAQARLLGSRLKQLNLLEEGVIVSLQQKGQSDSETYCSMDGGPSVVTETTTKM